DVKPGTPPPTDADVKTATDGERLLKIEFRNLLPKAAEQYRAAAGKEKIPIYVDTSDTDGPLTTQLAKTQEGTKIFFVNEAAHRWTEEYARQTLPTDADIAQRLQKQNGEDPQWTVMRREDLKDPREIELFNSFEAVAKRMKLHPMPPIYIDNTS